MNAPTDPRLGSASRRVDRLLSLALAVQRADSEVKFGDIHHCPTETERDLTEALVALADYARRWADAGTR